MSLTFHASLNNNFNDVVGSVDGTPANVAWKATRRGLKPELNGTDSKITFGNIGTIKTIALWVHLRSTTESIIDLNGTQTIDIAAGTVRGNNWSTPTIYVDGAATASLSNLTGYHQITITTATGIDASAVVAGLISASYGHTILDGIRGYDNELSAGEALTLYNATKGEHGPRIAEISYQHDPLSAITEQPGTVLSIGGKLPSDEVDTISDRALSNDATVFGAMPADDHYFIGGRRFDGDDDYLDCGNDSSLDPTSEMTINMLIKFSAGYGQIAPRIMEKTVSYLINTNLVGTLTAFIYIGSVAKSISISSPIAINELAWVTVKYDGAQLKIYVDSVLKGTLEQTGTIDTNTNNLTLGNSGNHTRTMSGDVLYSSINTTCVTDTQQNIIFNTLASLPIFELNFRDYPDNPGDTWTDSTLIPFSSGVVGSNGTFSVDGNQFICGEDTSTCTFRNNFKLDGQEYINVKINGIVYSGTGTITQGTVTVSIAQGSNKITIAANNGDVIDKIKIQFRATV